MKALRPVLAKAAGVPMPHDTVFDAVERLHAELEQVHALLDAALPAASGLCSRRRRSWWPRPAGRSRHSLSSATA